MNGIKIKNFDINYIQKLDRTRFLKWINEELEINSKFPFHNKDFNKLPGFTHTIIFNLDLKESKRCLNEWFLEEVSLIPSHKFKKKILKKLPINVNSE